ncbi:MAG: phosphoribosylglycinamide formyltransferase [Bacteroidota bacterium]
MPTDHLSTTHQIAIFASGSGSNAQKIMEYFEAHPQVRVTLVLTNNPTAGVLQRAASLHIPTHVFNRNEFYQTDDVLRVLQEHRITFIVLAGFLWLMPSNLVVAYPRRIVNIHPALLPKFGGKGMYGSRVHEAVVQAGEKESGITIHYVNEHYDEGQVIFQASCALQSGDTPEIVAHKVLELEHRHFPAVIEKVILNEKTLPTTS